MLSQRAKVQIEYMHQFRRRPSDHQHAVQTIADLILAGEIEQSNDVRAECQQLNWHRTSTDDLCAMVDDVGFTLLSVGKIQRW